MGTILTSHLCQIETDILCQSLFGLKYKLTLRTNLGKIQTCELRCLYDSKSLFFKEVFNP